MSETLRTNETIDQTEPFSDHFNIRKWLAWHLLRVKSFVAANLRAWRNKTKTHLYYGFLVKVVDLDCNMKFLLAAVWLLT
jgi:hypothetical protein